jgi:hypothetical protein
LRYSLVIFTVGIRESFDPLVQQILQVILGSVKLMTHLLHAKALKVRVGLGVRRDFMIHFAYSLD